MIRFLADENFDNDIVRGVRRRYPAIDIVRVQEVGLRTCPDEIVLAWAAEHSHILLTLDARTMTRHAADRVTAGLAMPGVFEVSRHAPHGAVIEDIRIIAECSVEGEWEGQVQYVPLRYG